MSAANRVHDEVAHGPLMRLTGECRRGEVSLGRRLTVRSVEKLIAGAGQQVIVFGLPAIKDRVAIRVHKPGLAEALHPFTDKAGGAERFLPRLAQSLELPGGHRRVVECSKHLDVARCDEPSGGNACHEIAGSLSSSTFHFSQSHLPSERKSSFIKVDELLPQISLEQAAQFYGVTLPGIRHVGDEVRMRCFLACGRTEETGDRAIAVQVNNPVKPWKCHVYECQKGGNLVGLCDLMKEGENGGGRPRGQRFLSIAADLAAMAGGADPPTQSVSEPVAKAEKAPAKPEVNLPLAGSENERARELVNLHEQFITDVADMPPEASAYFRRRPFLTPEVCQKFSMGYLPHSSKSLLRGHVVYGYRSPAGEVLTWFGRNVRYEGQHAQWKASDRSESEPIKTRFVKGFQRGLEVYGEEIVRAEGLKRWSRMSLLVVEGPNDAIRLNALGVSAVALCSNTITREQVERIATLARDLGAGHVRLMLDCDDEGINGAHQVLPLLADKVPVQLAWSSTTANGQFKGRQPENLTTEEWSELTMSNQ
jgi:hypothetical protein